MADVVKRILVVDDEKFFLCSLAEGFSDYSSKFCVMIANNGQAALEILKNADVDLVVTDLGMPVMDGFDFLALLREDHPDLPVIVMSAHISTEARQILSSLNVSQYVDKPVDYKQLAGVFSKSLESSESQTRRPEHE
jgi:CheY-like chemotaxis protein